MGHSQCNKFVFSQGSLDHQWKKLQSGAAKEQKPKLLVIIHKELHYILNEQEYSSTRQGAKYKKYC